MKQRNKNIWKASCLYVDPGQSFAGVARELREGEPQNSVNSTKKKVRAAENLVPEELGADFNRKAEKKVSDGGVEYQDLPT